ncbi:glycosyltransferase family 2 protein [Salegentibacter chungangensis]|uniref:Glycosyltransferase n=1 Tax=Salegentibacter chungangensis TaxID=1335724 RepID=A0ABW3NQA2_9FLAO
MVFLFVLIGICYLALIAALIYGWNRVKENETDHSEARTGFSVIIPFRNEAENLPGLLNSITEIKYPEALFEILLVNDESEDASEEICRNFIEDHPEISVEILQNIRLSNSPKKDALSVAIQRSGFEYIVTTDADCIVPEHWLQCFNEEVIKEEPELIAGPVGITQSGRKQKLFEAFEEMDFLSLQATGFGAYGIGKAFMCNGANLCYKKSAFVEASGFNGNDEIASGDDVFLLQKFKKSGKKISFLKSKKAVVFTKPQSSLKGLINQRMRWAAKASAYTDQFSKIAGTIVVLMNLFLITGAFAVLFKLMPYKPVMVLFLIKFNADFVLLFSASKFFRRELLMRNYFWSSLVYPFFSVLVAFKAFTGEFEWKGRSYRK